MIWLDMIDFRFNLMNIDDETEWITFRGCYLVSLSFGLFHIAKPYRQAGACKLAAVHCKLQTAACIDSSQNNDISHLPMA